MSNYYTWIPLETVSHDWLFLNSTLNMPTLSIQSLFDISLLMSVILPTLVSNYFTLNQFSSTSVLDLIITHLVNNNTSVFKTSLYLDLFLNLKNSPQLFESLLTAEGVDVYNVFLVKSPELLFVYRDYMNALLTFNVETVVLYNLFSFNTTTNYLDTLNNLLYITLWFLFFSISLTILSIQNFSRNFPFMFFRVTSYFGNFANENRLQLDWTVSFLLFIFICWIPTLMTYDDINVELVETTHSFICNFFILCIFYLIYKYSTHYFSFLENSVSEGFSTSFIAKQFVRDVSNTFALFLRFFLLIFRLNIYDGLDDFLDSYYIFFIDFDEDSYSDEFFATESYNIFISDNSEDCNSDKPLDLDLWGDLYARYFLLVSRFLLFWFFILEEIFRVLLAFYISYLIIFEVHAVNVSYNEETFFNNKRSN